MHLAVDFTKGSGAVYKKKLLKLMLLRFAEDSRVEWMLATNHHYEEHSKYRLARVS
jgi:hypothetical protein